MKRSRKQIKEQFPKMKKMHDNGYTVGEIAEAFNVSRTSVYDTFTMMGYSLKKRLIDESNLIYAINNPPVLEKVSVMGKTYTDITPLFAPR